MQYTKCEEIYEPSHVYRLTSLPCPYCQKTEVTDMAAPLLFMLNQGDLQMAQIVDRDIAERFISGICPSCWTNLFGDETHCEEETA